MTEMTPEKLREYAAEDCEVSTQRDFILAAASAWEADRTRLMEYDKSFRLYDEAMRRGTKLWQEAHPESAHVWPDAAKLAAWLMARIETLEVKAATWLALASPMWVGDENEGHFVCLACNQAGADDGGTKTIQHLPNCEYAAALAAGASAQPTMYPGSSALREWADLHGEQREGSS